jgi:hypothetical protein
MWMRNALALTAIVVASYGRAIAREDRPQTRKAQADHRRCIDEYRLKPCSKKYAECRRQLARNQSREPQRRRPEERSIWSSDNPAELSCKVWGYKPGTAAWAGCVKTVEINEVRRKQLEQVQTNCLRSGTGLITPMGGGMFQVSCYGRIFICPGAAGCPTCPGNIGCPPSQVHFPGIDAMEGTIANCVSAGLAGIASRAGHSVPGFAFIFP